MLTRNVAMPSRPFAEYRDTPLWATVEVMLAQLADSSAISVNGSGCPISPQRRTAQGTA